MIPRERPTPIARHLTDAVSEDELATAWRGVDRRRASRPLRRVLAIATPALAAAVALVALLAPRDELPAAGGPIAGPDGAVLSGVLRAGSVPLDEGSTIETDRDGELEVLANDDDEVTLHLRAGGARFSITPGGPRRWRVEGGGVSVEVVGTVFSVRRGGEAVRVAVERGVVIVRGARVPDGVQRVRAGESIEVAPPPPIVSEPAVAPIVSPPIEPSIAPVPPRREREAARWLGEADRARREGRDGDALELLARVVERHPRAPEAPLAAYTRARMLVSAGRDQEARAGYERALELGLPPALEAAAREALDR